MRAVAILSLVAALMSGPVLAQTQRLPRTSPAEQTYTDVNRSIQNQQRDLGSQQQQQFETNQLRQQIQRENLAPPRTTVPGRLGCPPTSVGC
jgi:predicted PurR-regulated permease PerM